MKGITKTRPLLNALVRILLFPLVFGLFGQASCSRENKIDPEEIDPIVGTWRMVLFNYDAEMDSGEAAGTISADGRDMDNVLITFHPNGTTSNNGNTFIVDQTITIGGHPTTQEIPTQPIIRNGTWKRNGNKLILERSDTPEPHEVTVDILEDGNFMHLNTLMPPPVFGPDQVSIPGLSGIILHIHLRRVN